MAACETYDNLFGEKSKQNKKLYSCHYALPKMPKGSACTLFRTVRCEHISIL